MNVILLGEEFEERTPSVCASSTGEESSGVANDDQSFASTRQQYVESFWRDHETDVATTVASSKTGDHDIAFFALIIIDRGKADWALRD
jgi:hypothetical protein